MPAKSTYRTHRPVQGDYQKDFDQHQEGINTEATARKALESEVAALKKQLASVETRIGSLSNASRSSVSSSASSGFTGTIGATQGGTGITSYSVGDLLYADALNSLTKLPIGTTLQLLRTNSGATAPEWATLYSPVWTKYTVGHADLDALSGSSDFVALFTLPAKGLVHAVVIKHSTAFSGGTVAACTVSVGISGTPAKYAAAFDIFQATGNTVFQVSATTGMENAGAGTVIRGTFTTTGDTLANLTAGSVDIWVLAGVLP